MPTSAESLHAEFDEFVLARQRTLLRTAYLLTGSHADAEDLLQTVLVKVVPHWTKISDDPEPYVRKVLARESVSRWRSRRWREVSTDRLPDTGRSGADADHADHAVQREDLRRALLQLAPRQRAVVVLRYVDDLTERETAAVLGIAVGTVKSQARDALTVLRRVLPTLDLVDRA